MTTYVVDVVFDTVEPLTVEEVERVAAFGGAAGGNPGDHRLDTGLSIDADSPSAAIERAIATLAVRGTLVAAEVMTVEEADRRLAEPAFPELAGVTEVAALLGVSRQRLHSLRERHEFPAPVALLAAGPVWRKADLSTFAEGWHRKPGRPRVAAQ
jgi:hypothetical protein